MTKLTKRKTIGLIAVVLVLSLAILCGVYIGDYYRMTESAAAALASDEDVTVRYDHRQTVFLPDDPKAGFIFYPGSSRYAGGLDARAVRQLPWSIGRVGVFVNEEPETIRDVVMHYRLDCVQLHGYETPEFCRAIGRTIPVIKAFSISSAADVNRALAYDDVCRALLFDTKTPQFGGSGRQFDWTLLDAYRGATPVLLSGGIGPDDAARVREMDRAGVFAVDLNSRFETAPGLKDAALLQQFMVTLKAQ